jgi:hypothetical protein
MPKENAVNLVFGPIEVAAKVHEDQQTRILSFIQGPQQQTRRTMVGGQPVDNVVERVLQRLRSQGL